MCGVRLGHCGTPGTFLLSHFTMHGFFCCTTYSNAPFNLRLLLVIMIIVSFWFSYSIKQEKGGDCSIELPAMGIPMELKGSEELNIIYSYSVRFVVSGLRNKYCTNCYLLNTLLFTFNV